MKKPKRARRRNQLAHAMAREPNRFRTRVKATVKQYTRKGRRKFRPFDFPSPPEPFVTSSASITVLVLKR